MQSVFCIRNTHSFPGQPSAGRICSGGECGSIILTETASLGLSFSVLCVSTRLLDIFYYCCVVSKSCPTLCDPVDCSLPVSSVCGIFQTRILEWVAISVSRVSS